MKSISRLSTVIHISDQIAFKSSCAQINTGANVSSLVSVIEKDVAPSCNLQQYSLKNTMGVISQSIHKEAWKRTTRLFEEVTKHNSGVPMLCRYT